ncbi:hypothetical protein AB4254_08490 [Vibrio breoganii]
MNTDATTTLNLLCSQYDTFSKNGLGGKRPFSTTLKTPHAEFYVRKMVGTHRLCLSNIALHPTIQHQGIFKKFVEYVTSHPYEYSGIEVELSYNQNLTNYLQRVGWSVKQEIGGNPIFIAPTLYFNFKNARTTNPISN